MRIIAGKLKGRRFTPPAGNWPTRPTTDFAKEGLFNILQHQVDFEGLKVLDLFGGTGNLSYECVSRGCAEVVYVDNHLGCLKFTEKTAKEFGITAQLKTVRADAFKFLERTADRYDLVLADPPYDHPEVGNLPTLVFEKKLLTKNGWFILEHNPHHNFEGHPYFLLNRSYGQTHLSFFRCMETDGTWDPSSPDC